MSKVKTHFSILSEAVIASIKLAKSKKEEHADMYIIRLSITEKDYSDNFKSVIEDFKIEHSGRPSCQSAETYIKRAKFNYEEGTTTEDDYNKALSIVANIKEKIGKEYTYSSSSSAIDRESMSVEDLYEDAILLSSLQRGDRIFFKGALTQSAEYKDSAPLYINKITLIKRGEFDLGGEQDNSDYFDAIAKYKLEIINDVKEKEAPIDADDDINWDE